MVERRREGALLVVARSAHSGLSKSPPSPRSRLRNYTSGFLSSGRAQQCQTAAEYVLDILAAAESEVDRMEVGGRGKCAGPANSADVTLRPIFPKLDSLNIRTDLLKIESEICRMTFACITFARQPSIYGRPRRRGAGAIIRELLLCVTDNQSLFTLSLVAYRIVTACLYL